MNSIVYYARHSLALSVHNPSRVGADGGSASECECGVIFVLQTVVAQSIFHMKKISLSVCVHFYSLNFICWQLLEKVHWQQQQQRK